jgi:hypothetical protein
MELVILMNSYPFATQLSKLLAVDIALALIDSYIPQEWTPVRWLIAAVELGFMALTMGVTMREVLKDY